VRSPQAKRTTYARRAFITYGERLWTSNGAKLDVAFTLRHVLYNHRFIAFRPPFDVTDARVILDTGSLNSPRPRHTIDRSSAPVDRSKEDIGRTKEAAMALRFRDSPKQRLECKLSFAAMNESRMYISAA
jgi:hypothetical protein